MNASLQVKTQLQFIKKEEKSYKDTELFYFLCNFFDADGMASPVKVKVTRETFDLKLSKGDVLDVFADITGDYLRVNALDVKKLSAK